MTNCMFTHGAARSAKTIALVAMLVASHSISTPAAPVFDSTSGHFYDSISIDGGISWAQAKSVAEATALNGTFAHLATITSQAEQDFLANHFSDAVTGGFWLGGSQAPGEIDPVAGWSWVTGEAWGFTNWLPGEPNDFQGVNEDALAFHAFAQVLDGHWNDVGHEFLAPGFVVEWEPASTPDSGSTLLLLASTAGSLSFLRRRV